jgi:hypothetical protein
MIIGSITKGASQLANINHSKKVVNFSSSVQKQKKVLLKLLNEAKDTEFGKTFGYSEIIASSNPVDTYQKLVPIFQYDYMFKSFWYKTLQGIENVSWPGKIKNFALTSGTTNSSSKKIPVSSQMVKGIKRSCLRQLLTLNDLKLPISFYEKHVLVVGGSTELTQVSDHLEGDLSGILTGRVPHFLNPFTKPSKKVRAIGNWDEKLDKIVENASKWDVGIICGVPSWVNLLINKIIEHYQIDSIFELWPSLKIYIHGGVSFTPYITSFNALFNDKVIYLDTYLASEGFLGFQGATESHMKLTIDNGIFFEFIPFNSNHFDGEGNLINYSDALQLHQIEANVNYALLISTNSGAFRYLIGDTIKFSDVQQLKFKISGRTKHFLNLCGEHLTVDNMTEAITTISSEYGIKIEEFAVLGKRTESGAYCHKWYLASNSALAETQIIETLDKLLCALNDDYAIQRLYNLGKMELEVLPCSIFYGFLKVIDKYGSQHKFPRVLKGKLAHDWEHYLSILIEENARTLIYWQSGNTSIL